MPTYALLGATGATGSAILRYLISEPQPDLKLNIFVRSRSKLSKAFPSLNEQNQVKINITEGCMRDNKALQRCIKGTDVIFMCVATNDSKPGQRVVQDAAEAIVNALKALRSSEGDTYRTPVILQNRSASLNEALIAGQPWIMHSFLMFVL